MPLSKIHDLSVLLFFFFFFFLLLLLLVEATKRTDMDFREDKDMMLPRLVD